MDHGGIAGINGLSSNSGNLVKAIDYNSLPMIEPVPEVM